jgi:hypothetical protein
MFVFTPPSSALCTFTILAWFVVPFFAPISMLQLLLHTSVTILWVFIFRESIFDWQTHRLSQKPSVPEELTGVQIEPLALRRWKDVLIWITFSSQELLLVDKKKQTVLHHACLFQAPAHVIELILLQEPELASMANVDGEIPLHWAIRLALSNQVLRILLSASPSSGVYARDKDGNTPLSLLWERHQDSLLRLWWSNRDCLLSSPSWNRIMFLMRCSYFGGIDHPPECDSDCLDLHIAARCPCPPALFPLALRVYRHQIKEQDAHGRTPLAVACGDSMANRNCDVLTKIELILAERESRATVRVPDNYGRIPFFTALASGVAWDEGVQKFFEIDSSLISMQDPVTSLYPFMLAAVGSSTNSRPSDYNNDEAIRSLTTIYNLLRADPVQACEKTRRFTFYQNS